MATFQIVIERKVLIQRGSVSLNQTIGINIPILFMHFPVL